MLKTINNALSSIQAEYAALFGLLLFLIPLGFKLYQWWKNKADLKITANLTGESTTDYHVSVLVEVVNNGKRIARVKKVFLVGLLSEHDGNIKHTAHTIALPQKEESVDLLPDGGMKPWRGVLYHNPPFQYYIKNGIKYGIGFVELTSVKKI